jgi:hypothetical protein
MSHGREGKASVYFTDSDDENRHITVETGVISANSFIS